MRTLCSNNGTDAVIFAIGDKQHSATVHQHSVWPRQGASARIGFRAVALLTGAQHGPDEAGLEIDRADHVILGVRDVQRPPPPRETFGPGQRRRPSLAAVSGVSLLAGAGDVVDRECPGIHLVDGIAFPERQIEIPGVVEHDGPGTVQRRRIDARAVRRRLALSGAAERRDRAG